MIYTNLQTTAGKIVTLERRRMRGNTAPCSRTSFTQCLCITRSVYV